MIGKSAAHCQMAKGIIIENCDTLTKKRKQHPSQGDDASGAAAILGRVGRDEQGEARRANTTPNGGPHLELGRAYTTQKLV